MSCQGPEISKKWVCLLLRATKFYEVFIQGTTPSVSSQIDYLDTRGNTPGPSTSFPEPENPETVKDLTLKPLENYVGSTHLLMSCAKHEVCLSNQGKEPFFT